MADISKCRGEGCPKKDRCYRYTAPSNMYRQSYMSPPRKEDGSCDEYWPNDLKEYIVELPEFNETQEMFRSRW